MNSVVFISVLAFIMLYACSSNQTTDVNEQRLNDNLQINQSLDSKQQTPHSPIIPIDGRLTKEHIQMYVAVKIRQEQLRYQQEEAVITDILNTDLIQADNNYKQLQPDLLRAGSISPAIYFEKQALESFNYKPQLYHWVKQTIQRTEDRKLVKDISNKKRASNFEEFVLSHNMKMIKKFNSELQFAANYQIAPPAPIKHLTATLGSGVATQQMALIFKPSS